MKNREILSILALIFIVTILSISAVSAAEDTTDDIISADDGQELILDESIADDVSTSDNDNDNEDIILDDNNDDGILESGDETPTGTFTQLNQAINGNNNATISLNSNYKYSEGDDNFIHGIKISRELTINGNGFTLDGSHIASIFYMEDGFWVTFKDINFINGNATGSADERHGGAISIRRGNCIAENCNFTNNTASGVGGAMRGGSAYNCTFTFNSAEWDGGAMSGGSAFDCNFTGNSASGHGGAMHKSSASGCTFTGNSALGGVGGAMYDGSASNCTFTNNTASGAGGAMSGVEMYSASGCTFTGNSALGGAGGAMYMGSASGCTFILNSASFGGDDTEDTECDDDCTFIVPQFIVSDFTSTYNSGEKLLFNLTYEEQNYDDYNTTIKVYQNEALIGTYYALSGENGGWIVNLTEGIYHIALSLERFSKVNEAMATIYIIPIPTTISAPNITATYNNEDYLVVALLDSEGNPISNAQMSVELNEETVNYTTNETGQIEVPTKGLLPNTYIVTLSYAGNGFYKGSSTTAVITINKYASQITATGITTTYNVNKDILITLTDGEGNPLSDFTVSVDLNGVKNYTTDSNGQVKVSTKGLIPKTYTATISYAGNDLYNESSATAKVTINKINTKLTAAKVTATYNVNKYLIITLKDASGNPLAKKKITVKVGSIAKNLTTNSSGKVAVLISKLVPKTYTASISFAGDSYYNKSSAKATVVVKKATPKLTASAKTFRVKVKVKKYKITLKTNKNKVMKNIKVTLKVNKKTFTAKTNKKGVATFKITNLKKRGKFTAVIKYAGNKYYNKLTKKAKINVKK